MTVLSALRVAVAWMTVIPTGLRDVPDARLSGRAMTALPMVGVLCGLVVAGVTAGVQALGASSLLAATLGVAAVVMLTRGMHIDALADTVDALGSYANPERARQIMQSGTVGPMGAAAVALVLMVEVTAVSQLAQTAAWPALIAAFILSRCLPVPVLRRNVPAASPSGFGAQVAQSQSTATVVVVGAIAAAAGAGCAVQWSAAPAPIPLVVGAVAGVALYTAAGLFTRHAVRRLGGISGDVLGATIEVGTASALVVAALLG